jgi:hypothetical protein
MAYTRPCGRAEVALSRHRRTQKISPTTLWVCDGRQRVATIVLVGVDTVEPRYVVLRQHDRRVGTFRSFHKALRAVLSRGRAR